MLIPIILQGAIDQPLVTNSGVASADWGLQTLGAEERSTPTVATADWVPGPTTAEVLDHSNLRRIKCIRRGR